MCATMRPRSSMSRWRSLARSDHHGARSRASLVVAGMLHYARRDEESPGLVRLARRHATTEGDGAALSSIMYNMAFLRVLDARVADLRDPGGCPEGVLRRRCWAPSPRHLDRSVQTRALSNHPPMRRAQILLLTGEIETALALYEEHTRKAIEEGLASRKACSRADQAWCLAMLGQRCGAAHRPRCRGRALHGAVEPEDLVIATACSSGSSAGSVSTSGRDP